MDSIALENNIPIINYNSNELNQIERKYSNFYKCCQNDGQKCYWTSNNVRKFLEHLKSHQNLSCIYCRFDSIHANSRCFRVRDPNLLVEHLVTSHGQRRYQCNQCLYRANTKTHVLLHQISSHYHIWSNNTLVSDFETINETYDSCPSNICKIIVCKNVCFSLSVHHSIWIKEFGPKLDPNLPEYHCLFCNYSSEEVIHVFLHCVQNHCDFDVCVWHKECNDNYSLESFSHSSKFLPYNCDSSESIDSNLVLCKPQHIKSKNYRNGCESKNIPGLEDNFKPPLRRESYESFGNVDYNATPMDISDPEEFSQQSSLANRLPTDEGRNSQVAPNNEPNQNNDFYSSNHSHNNPVKRSFNCSDAFSTKRSCIPSSTPLNRPIPPPINLERTDPQISSQLNSSNTSPNKQNAAKQKRRVVPQNNNKKSDVNSTASQNCSKSSKVSYIQRKEKESDDEYLEIINESEARTPKRGVKARFENFETFFEPTAPPKTQLIDKNIFHCLICKENGLRINKIDFHLQNVHKTTSSFKCGYCEFIGHKLDIRDHSKLKHPSLDPKIDKFIVPQGQDTAIGLSSATKFKRVVESERRMTARKKTNASKGALMQQIKESTFMGPLKNDKTNKKRQMEADKKQLKSDKKQLKSNKRQMEADGKPQPYIRVKSQGRHSSNIKPKKPIKPVSNQVAKKSTTNQKAPTCQNNSETLVVLTDEQIPTKYFCVFCSESFILDNKADAIEHYKTHLNLGYTCAKCHYFVISYEKMEHHMNSVHPNEEVDTEDNMTDVMRKWILNFLDNQIKNCQLVKNDSPSSSSGISIECPVCVKAAVICRMKAHSFDALWKVKLHLCKHLYWMSMKCNLCEHTDIMFPNSPYLLMKHLVDLHFTSKSNLFNKSFRGHKPFNDMKSLHWKAIEKNYVPLRVTSSDIVDSFFQQLMDELDVVYENQLKLKFGINKEISVDIERLVHIKSEPIEDQVLISDDEQRNRNQNNTKADIKTKTKSEIETENKREITCEEVKDEVKSYDNFLGLLYGDDCASTFNFNRSTSEANNDIETIDLSSDDES